MPRSRPSRRLALTILISVAALAVAAKRSKGPGSGPPGVGQVPGWSAGDVDTFLNGTIGTEFIPEAILHALVKAYPELFPKGPYETFGLAVDEGPGPLPPGISRRAVDHLGGLPSIGINCASCHSGGVSHPLRKEKTRVYGMAAPFDVDSFYGAVIVATFKTADAGNMKRYLREYLRASDPGAGDKGEELLEDAWKEQAGLVKAAVEADPGGGQGVSPGALHKLKPKDLALDLGVLQKGPDLAGLSYAHLKLFHNMRAALHLPDAPPKELPPPPGPGRNNAFGLLSYGLLGIPPVHAPVKFGYLWNVGSRRWVHWDGNTSSPLIRNLAGALGLGAPLIGKRGVLDMAAALKQTDLTERILAPRYPWEHDPAAAARGAAHFKARCASCHVGPEDDRRLHSPSEVGTDDQRTKLFTPRVAAGFNKFFAELVIPGYTPPKMPTLRSTGKYWAADLRGTWARSPYLHNGSVRTMKDLLSPGPSRPKTYRRGSSAYDPEAMGFADEGPYLFDAAGLGNSNAGHEYGTDLAETHRRELIEYLKTL